MTIDKMESGDVVCAFLRDYTASLFVGVHANEKLAPQPVIINVEVEAPAAAHYRGLTDDHLDRVINYQPICEFVQNELPKLGHISLLETIAEHIIDVCFRDARIQKARVRLEKTQIIDGATVGIELTRRRHISA